MNLEKTILSVLSRGTLKRILDSFEIEGVDRRSVEEMSAALARSRKVVQATALAGQIHWILETKGRVWVGTDAKDAAMTDWYERVSRQTKKAWRFVRVNQVEFERVKPRSLADLLDGR